MNKKTKTYLLIIIVFGIWGTIAYKIISGLSANPKEITAQNFDNTFTPKNNTKTEVFSIENVERDPFLGTLTYLRKKKPSNSKAQPKKTKNTPLITYGGLIKKQSSINQVFVVNIDNKQYLLKKGQTADSVKLIRGNTKEITVRYNNKSQIITRQ